MNTFMNALRNENNFTYTENGAGTYTSTLDGLLDLFALGGAYRTRTDAECINLFQKAFQEDEVHALKCLFYLGKIRITPRKRYRQYHKCRKRCKYTKLSFSHDQILPEVKII